MAVTITSHETSKTRLVVGLDGAKEKIESQMAHGRQLMQAEIFDREQFNQLESRRRIWHDVTRKLLATIVSTDELAIEFDSMDTNRSWSGKLGDPQKEISNFREDMKAALNCLQSVRACLDLFQPPTDFYDPEHTKATDLVIKLVERFYLVVLQLRERHNNRTPLEIQDEYDVQDLLRALLKVFFDDVRPEVWNPSYAGGASRVDFILKREQVAIEVKKTRSGLGKKEIADQLMVDIMRYRANTDCRSLICFIYDPERFIANPYELENDLSHPINGMIVAVLVEPK